MRPAQFIEPFIRAFRWHRRWFAAILASIAVLAALTALSPAEAGTVPVVVASHQVPGGSTLTAGDLQILRLPEDAVPEGAFSDPSGLIGGEVVVTVPARRPLTAFDLLASGSLVVAGKVAVPVRFGDADASAILKVGNRVDILGQASSGAAVTTIARDVRVVAVPGGADGGVLSSSSGGIVLIEADETQSTAVLSASSVGTLGYVLK